MHGETAGSDTGTWTQSLRPSLYRARMRFPPLCFAGRTVGQRTPSSRARTSRASTGRSPRVGDPDAVVRDLLLSREDIYSVPELTSVLGDAADRYCSVGRLLSTLKNWSLARSAEARCLRGEHNALSRTLQRFQCEVVSAPDASRIQATAYKRAVADCDRYRQKREGLRAARAVPKPNSRPDSYATPGPNLYAVPMNVRQVLLKMCDPMLLSGKVKIE